jgi:hypothetical protein
VQCLIVVFGSGGGLWHVVPPGETCSTPIGRQVLWFPSRLANHAMSASPRLQTRKSLGYCGSSLGVIYVPGVLTAKLSRCGRGASVPSGSQIQPVRPHISSTIPFHGSASGSWIPLIGFRAIPYQVLSNCGSQRGLAVVADIPPT